MADDQGCNKSEKHLQSWDVTEKTALILDSNIGAKFFKKSFHFNSSLITCLCAKLLKLFHLAKSFPTLWGVTKLPGPRHSKNVEPQWGLFDLTGIQMSAGPMPVNK